LIHKGWKGCWIEAKPSHADHIRTKFGSLLANGRLQLIADFVSAENINSRLERSRHNGEDLDFLSIDIDGNDIYLLEALSIYPKVICIEYNAKFRPPVSKKPVYKANYRWTGTDYMGASLVAIAEAARNKGYALVGTNITGSNAFLVRDDLVGDLFCSNRNVDYGCGIGRMAKELISRYDCRVVGVDISPSMRALSVIYVQSDRFCCCSPLMLDAITDRGFRFDAAISIWVLQHCQQPSDDVARIRNALKVDGRLFVLNGMYRAVPAVDYGKFKWHNDGIDLRTILTREFELEIDGHLPPSIPGGMADTTFWASLRKRGSA
jgi:SAM-dependent methyltransferase